MSHQENDEVTLIELNKQMGDAEKSRNIQFMQDILSDALVFRRADKTVTDKSTYLEGLKNPTNIYERLDVSDVVVVHRYEDLAVVSLIVEAVGMRGENSFSGQFHNVRIFMKEEGAPYEWKCHKWFNVRIH